ncbi:MAG: transglycosylase domain-containing protein [Candidatus Nealsonbacteria bacterium]
MPKRRFYRKIYQKDKKGKRRSRSLLILKFFGYFLLFFVFISLFLFVYYAKDLPRPERFTEKPFIQSTKIYDKTGEILLYDIYGEEKRDVISLDQVPEYLKEAVIVAEDINFYHHFGLDIKGIIRAVLSNLRVGKAIYGGSTISQQLIRSSFLTREKTLKRKVREIILTLELERRYSKDEILEFYLNQVPFGSNTYGVEAACQTYFNKPISEISLPEAAILVSLIRSPSYLSPYGEHKDKLLSRKDYILDRMLKEGYLTQEERDKTKESEITFAKILQPIRAPHFVMYVMEYLKQRYGEDFLKEKGLRVYTSLDWELQEWAEKVIKEGGEINKNYRAHNASLVAIDPKTGQILAMVGSIDYFGDLFPEDCLAGENCLFEPYPNVTIRGRQPGSAFKPFVYATAFKKGYDDKVVVIDEETNFGTPAYPYIPRNYDGLFRGQVSLRQALAQSLNVPSIKVLANFAGLQDSIQTAKDLGITTLTKPPSFYGLPLVLGGGEVTLLEMVSAYGTFAAKGWHVPPVSILKIEDSTGNIIEENKKTPKMVLEPEVASLINDILSDNEARAPMFGSRPLLYFESYQVAAKTGTTQNYKDGWVIGYTPSIAAGVWVGNNNNSSMSKQPGIVLAGPIWRRFMEKVLLLRGTENF